MTPKELAQKARFDAVYDRSQAAVMLAIERKVCGCDYGGNSWTTRSEADELARHLRLTAGARLLDLGAGSGWPALYLAKRYRCEVVLVDLPETGLRIAGERAARDGLSAMVSCVVADAAGLPLSESTVDAISHSDLLCCLERKRSVLDGCRRVVRQQGRMAFTVISVAPGLSADQYRRAVANGPEFIECDADYPTLLRQTGWVINGHQDLTAAYGASCARQLDADHEHEHELKALIGHGEFAERRAGWCQKLAAIRDGLLLRELFVASPD